MEMKKAFARAPMHCCTVGAGKQQYVLMFDRYGCGLVGFAETTPVESCRGVARRPSLSDTQSWTESVPRPLEASTEQSTPIESGNSLDDHQSSLPDDAK